jgi:hypothetical protein
VQLAEGILVVLVYPAIVEWTYEVAGSRCDFATEGFDLTGLRTC